MIGRNDGAGRLAGAERVERPQRHRWCPETQVVGLDQLVGGDLGRRVRRLGLQQVRLADRDGPGRAVGLAGRGVHQAGGPAGAHRLQHVQRADHVGVHERPGRRVGIRGPRRARPGGTRPTAPSTSVAHRRRVAHVAENHVDLVQDVGCQRVQPALRAVHVVEHHGPYPVSPAHQRLDQVRADETFGPGHRDLVRHGHFPSLGNVWVGLIRYAHGGSAGMSHGSPQHEGGVASQHQE